MVHSTLVLILTSDFVNETKRRPSRVLRASNPNVSFCFVFTKLKGNKDWLGCSAFSLFPLLVFLKRNKKRERIFLIKSKVLQFYWWCIRTKTHWEYLNPYQFSNKCITIKLNRNELESGEFFRIGIYSEPIRIILKSVIYSFQSSLLKIAKIRFNQSIRWIRANLKQIFNLNQSGCGLIYTEFSIQMNPCSHWFGLKIWFRFIRIEVSDWIGLFFKWFSTKGIENFFRIDLDWFPLARTQISE